MRDEEANEGGIGVENGEMERSVSVFVACVDVETFNKKLPGDVFEVSRGVLSAENVEKSAMASSEGL